MKLTKTLREAFVNAAMADVPSTDYHEQIQKAALAGVIAHMPDAVRAAYKKHPEWFGNSGHYFEGPGYIYLPAPDEINLPDALRKELLRIDELSDAQNDSRNQLYGKLMGAANSATTRKALAELLPEFTQYLPPEETGTRNLPAIANIVADFTKAGWPKNAKAAKKKAA